MQILLLSMLLMTGCVTSDVPESYAERAHPTCKAEVTAHTLAKTSESEVYLSNCEKEEDRTIAVKCTFGWGIISDTVCHENN